jgi:uracil-DNA glycosylase family 4
MGLITFSGCDACSLKKEWKYLRNPRMATTLPDDPSEYRVLVLGEGPGEQEDLKGHQFVGTTGQYLRDRIPAKWKRSLYWQNVVRCQPPKNRDPSAQEMQCCSTYLEQDLLAIKPHAILAVGGVALRYFWSDFNKGITKARGIPFPVELEDQSTTWVFPIFHPRYSASGDKKQSDGTYENVIEPIFRNDILKFFNLLTTKFVTPPIIQKPPVEQFLYPKSYNEAWNLFCKLSDPYAIDFETFKTKPYKRDAKPLTMALSDGKITFAVPVCWPGDLNPWGLELLKDIILSGKIWICQSGAMEYLWITYLTGKRCEFFHDTEVLARLLHDRTGLGALEHTSKIYLGFNIKSLSNLDKERMNEYPLNQVLPYNAGDSWSTYRVFEIMMRLLCERKGDFVENYCRTIDTIKSTVEMEIQGLDVDINQSEAMQKDLYTQQQDIIKRSRQFKEVKEYEQRESTIFSISAPQNVASVLTSYCGIRLFKNEDSGFYSTAEDELEPFRGQHPLVDLTLEYREVAKQLSTYVMPILNGEILGIDGRLHPAYKCVHVRTWRLSSELPNIQNWPKRKNREIRRQVIAPPGHLILSCDYGGIEARGIQMQSQDENLRKALVDPEGFLHDIDIHWYWLHRILDLHPDYIKHLKDASGETEDKKAIKVGRTIIKTDFVFPTFYGSEAQAASARTGVPIKIMERVHDEFWSLFPKAKKWVDGQFEFYHEHGYVESLVGRPRNEILPGNEPANSPTQELGAVIVLEAQNALYHKALDVEDMYFLPRINIHDDLGYLVPDNNETERYIRTIGSEMVKPRFPFVTVPLLVEFSAGYNWCDENEICKATGGIWGEENKVIWQ